MDQKLVKFNDTPELIYYVDNSFNEPIDREFLESKGWIRKYDTINYYKKGWELLHFDKSNTFLILPTSPINGAKFCGKLYTKADYFNLMRMLEV